MAYVTGVTRGKKAWTPHFVKAIDAELCIGCEACGRTCKKGAFAFEPLVE